MTNEALDKMIEDHWGYVLGLITTFGADTQTAKECEFMYKSAFKHGYKHALEEDSNVGIAKYIQSPIFGGTDFDPYTNSNKS